MTTLASDITDTQDYVPGSVASGFYQLDSEIIRVRAEARSSRDARGDAQISADGRYADRALGGTTAAAHTAGTTFTPVNDPAAPGDSGGSSIPTGSGSPVGVVTPSGIGALYVDTTNGAFYSAIGVTSADWSRVGGGIARNVGQADFVASPVLTADQTVYVAFAYDAGDAGLIDLTTPASPAPVEAGLYAYTLTIVQQGGGDGGEFDVIFVVDDDWYSIPLVASHPRAGADIWTTYRTLFGSVTWFSDAGSPMRVRLHSELNDPYYCTLYIQRIS